MKAASTSKLTFAMAHPRTLLAPLSRLGANTAPFLQPNISRVAALPYQTIRCATTKSKKTDSKKKKKTRNTFLQYDLKHAEQFALVDAMQ